MLGSRYWSPNHLKRIENIPERNQDFEFEQTDKFEKVIWSNTAKDDVISLKLNGILTDIEAECNIFIGKKTVPNK